MRKQNLNTVEKVLIGLVLGFQLNGRKCFAQTDWILDQLGLREDIFWKCVERLEKLGILQKIGDEWLINLEELNNENNNKSTSGRSKGEAR